jgi:hypothetical protein
LKVLTVFEMASSFLLATAVLKADGLIVVPVFKTGTTVRPACVGTDKYRHSLI